MVARTGDETSYCLGCGRAIADGELCADCEAEQDVVDELARLHDGVGTPDELADYAATRRLIQDGE